VHALVPTRDHPAEHLRQPGAEVAARDLREIADIEPGAGTNRAVVTATARHSVQFPEQRCSAYGFRQAGWSAPAERVAGAGGLLPDLPRGTARVFSREVLAGHDALACEPLARHHRLTHDNAAALAVLGVRTLDAFPT
jgi:hypothetical protein